MDNPVTGNAKVEDEEEAAKFKNNTETEISTISTTVEPPPTIDYETKKLVRDAKTKRKDEKTVQQVLKSLDGLKTPEEKLSAMCKKYSELLHDNRQLQATAKQLEKNINMIHREKEQFRHERTKAVLAKMRMEQLCRELQKLNKAQQEETALKLRVEEEKRKEICFTFQSTFAEMNTLTHQNNEKSAKMIEENFEMREKIKSAREGIELTEAQLDKVRQQSLLELELAEKKHLKATLELTAERDALMEDKSQLLMKLAQYHVRVKELEGMEQFLKKQITIYEEKFEELKRNIRKTTDSLKNFGPGSREMKKELLKWEKATALWKQRWEKTNAMVIQLTKIKEKREAEIVTLNNKLTTLQELCKVLQRDRSSLMAKLKEKNENSQIVEGQKSPEENTKSTKEIETLKKENEDSREDLSTVNDSITKVEEPVKILPSVAKENGDSTKETKKIGKKMKTEVRKKLSKQKEETEISCEKVETEVEEKNEKQSEVSRESEKRENTAEIDKPEVSDAETAILERNELVLKDIENLLAEQAILEAKIASFQETEETIIEVDEKKIIENSEKDLNQSFKEIDDQKKEKKEETSEIPDAPISQKETKQDLGKTSTTEFLMVHRGSEPDTAICEPQSIQLDDDLKEMNFEKIEVVEESK